MCGLPRYPYIHLKDPMCFALVVWSPHLNYIRIGIVVSNLGVALCKGTAFAEKAQAVMLGTSFF